MAVRGDGAYVIDAAGRRYLDASGGAAVSCLGHSHAAVVEAIREQVARLACAHTALFTNEPMEELATTLAQAAPGGLDRVYFVSGGSVPWTACAFGAREHACVVAAAAFGGHVRVGFENNLRLRDGRTAPDNAALVAQVAEAARVLGRPLATAAEVRDGFRALP